MKQSSFVRRTAATLLSASLAVGACLCALPGIQTAPKTLQVTAADATLENGLSYILADGGALITDCDETATEIVIPNQIEGESVIAIGLKAFENCNHLTSIVLPSTLETINERAFYACTALTELTLPESVLYIGNGAFCDCTALTTLNLPDGVEHVGDYVFEFCNKLLEVVDGIAYVDNWVVDTDETVTSSPRVGTVGIADGSFADATCLQTLKLPSGLRVIGEKAFSYCETLQTVTFPDSLQRLGMGAFATSALKGVVALPKNLEVFDGGAFAECEKITAFTIAADNPSFCVVDGVLFSKDMRSLYQFPAGRGGNYVVPDGVASVEYGAFAAASKLTGITLPDSLISIGSFAFELCAHVTSFVIPDSVQSIGAYAFYNCTFLETIVLPKGIHSLADYALCANELKGLTIPENVQAIESALYATKCTFVCIANPNCNIPMRETTIHEDTVILAQAGSTAQAYAEQFNRKFLVWSKKPVQMGDVNQNGTVDAGDATLALQQYVTSIAYAFNYLSVEPLLVSDINQDGEVRADDATAILQYYVQGLTGMTQSWAATLQTVA